MEAYEAGCASGTLCNHQQGKEIAYEEGTYYWNVTCYDSAGNVNRSNNWMFYVDNSQPSITQTNITATDPGLRIINWSNSVDVGTNITFRAIVSDSISAISAVWIKYGR